MKIIKSDKILNSLSWFFDLAGITLWPLIIIRPGAKETTINHESIHIKQQGELLVLPFYVLYLLEYIIRSIAYLNIDKAYENISFEREAYSNQDNPDYLISRKRYSWVKYLFN